MVVLSGWMEEGIKVQKKSEVIVNLKNFIIRLQLHFKPTRQTGCIIAMLPTPSTSHVSFDAVYEPAEDSFLFLDTLSSADESSWLKRRFASPSPTPLLVEVGTGSGVVLGFVAGDSLDILGRRDVVALGIDVNREACLATRETVEKTIRERQGNSSSSSSTGRTEYASSIVADLCRPICCRSVDVLLFNPPYVPTEDLPVPAHWSEDTFQRSSYLLALSYAGGEDGMQVTNRLLSDIPGLLTERGVAYVLLCKQNRPDQIMERIRAWGGGWMVESVGSSGLRAGWEKLVILRIWRDHLGS